MAVDSAATPRLNQLQVSYVPREDRLLLRVNLTDGREFAFWLTRALTRDLWPMLRQCADGDQLVQRQDTEAGRRAVQEFQHQAAVAMSDFATPYQAPARSPAAPPPGLVIGARLQPRTGEPLQLHLQTDTGTGIRIPLGHRLLHALLHMLTDTTAKAGWDLPMDRMPADALPPDRLN